jgi:YesN/AraC family two-component response regulator
MNDKKIVLVAEDEGSIRGALCEKLSIEGFTVFEAENGEEGLEIALREHPDLILTDILMPKMDGLTMIKKLREDEWGKHVGFIILTNANEFDKISKAMKLAEINDHESFEYFIKSDVKLSDVVEKVKKKIALNS